MKINNLAIKKHRRLNLFILFLMSITLTSFTKSFAGELKDMDKPINHPYTSKQFLKMFYREIQTRAYAKIAVDYAESKSRGKPSHTFWKSYQIFENRNQDIYEPLAKKYGFDMSPSYLTKLKEIASRIPITTIPSRSLKVMRDATENYINVLKNMEDIAPESDASFFHYVVLQEKSQEEALRKAMDGDFIKAADILDNFVKHHRENQDNCRPRLAKRIKV